MAGRKVFEDNMQDMHERLLKMGLLVEEAIFKSVKSFTEKDIGLAQEVIKNDSKINRYEVDIEKKCFEMIATQQPVGTDLRRIGTMLKVVTDLERMGDHAVSIAKIAVELKKDTYLKPFVKIPQMADTVKEMVHEGLNAYIILDEDKAVEVAKKDDKIDRKFRAIFNELMGQMKQNQANIHHASFMLLVLQHLERIGDYVTNVCEWIVYLKTGVIVDLNN
ncbi:phosphate signaling complex protein PhoU [Heyndrickxia acidiproducens]|uniref:phosphate signaling complex protein PhoU n=1 Tax=Heyndrickxia acidiproducens TaxID=1121084 RepID=UPI0003668E57|nr:phosphate signaling complex protein PhoU [Heyndrickxia acidiproducens]